MSNVRFQPAGSDEWIELKAPAHPGSARTNNFIAKKKHLSAAKRKRMARAQKRRARKAARKPPYVWTPEPPKTLATPKSTAPLSTVKLPEPTLPTIHKALVLASPGPYAGLTAHFTRTRGVWHCSHADKPIEWFARCSPKTIGDWLHSKHIASRWIEPSPNILSTFHTLGNRSPEPPECVSKYNPVA